MSHVVLRGRWCDIIVLNVHVPTEDTTDGTEDSFYEELERLFSKFPMYHMKMLDFNGKIGREDIFEPTAGNESLHEISNENGGVIEVNYAPSKNQFVNNTILPHRSINKFTCASPDGPDMLFLSSVTKYEPGNLISRVYTNFNLFGN
jgi:hypothetical protein